MTGSEPTTSEAGLRRAALMGIVAGMRSQMPLGIMARAIDHGEFDAPAGSLGLLLRSPQGRRVLKLSALGEVIGDKTPFAPSRLTPKPVIGRLGFGAIAAATLAQTQGTPVLSAALRGAAGAGLGSVIGYAFRVVVGRVTGLPDLLVALAEDAIAVGLARSAIHPEALAELAAEQSAQSSQMEPSTTAAEPAPHLPPPTAGNPASTPPADGEPVTEDLLASVPSPS